MGEKTVEWTDEELESAVDAYLWMLHQEIASKPYNKSEVNKSLRNGSLSDRTKASIEYRMQNISAALDELCLPRISGYLPAKNIGTNVKDKIRSVLANKNHISLEDYEPTSDPKELDAKVVKLKKTILNGVPRGNKRPEKMTTSASAYVRDPLVKAWILIAAKGKCEGCLENAPFVTLDGTPYLEVHHVIPLAENGPDEISNAVAFCPNCHRRAHSSADKITFIDELYIRIHRLKH